jgi:hypothetical protein
MSRIFGPIRQMAYLVRDIDQAMRHWIDIMGVGPFFYIENHAAPHSTYRGQPSSMRLSIAFAQCGAMQIELIQPLNDAPSLLTEFLKSGREGLQHVAFWTMNFAADITRYQSLGYEVVQTGGMSGPNNGNVFFAGNGYPAVAHAIEISDISGTKGALFRHIAEAAQDWDGREPIRKLSPG